MGKKKKVQGQDDLYTKEFLLKDIEDKVRQNGDRPLSWRQLKKTVCDVPYEVYVKVIGGGDPSRLYQVMMDIVERMKKESESKNKRDAEVVEVLVEAENTEVAEVCQLQSEVLSPAVEVECLETVGSHKEKNSEEPQMTSGRKRWTRDMLLTFLYGKYRELGRRMPSLKKVAEWSKDGECPSYTTWRKLLDERPKSEWEGMMLDYAEKKNAN